MPVGQCESEPVLRGAIQRSLSQVNRERELGLDRRETG